jgi:hypothetical protein
VSGIRISYRLRAEIGHVETRLVTFLALRSCCSIMIRSPLALDVENISVHFEDIQTSLRRQPERSISVLL